MSTTTAVRTATLPRVNLLPPEISEEARFRSVRGILALTVIAAAGVVGGLYYLAANDASSAQEQLSAAQATQTSLQAEAAKYAEVPKVYAALTAAQTQLDQAMGQEVRYSYVLNDLSLTIPSKVWLTQMTVTQDVDGTGSVTGAWGSPAIGKITFTGVALSHNDVAAWLDALAKNATYTDPYFTNSSAGEPIGTTPVVDFNSEVSLTDKALSGRYTSKAVK